MDSRYVVVGAGAIGGVLAVRLVEHGVPVVLVARGAQADAIARYGLTLRAPSGVTTARPPVVTSVADLEWQDGDRALLAVKGQHTVGVLEELAAVTAPSTPIVCLQNGVENERAALRRFANVYAVPVLCPAAYLEPGVVEAYADGTTGCLDVGRYPTGSDGVAREISAVFAASGYVSQVRDDVMRWKWVKLIGNLANAVEAVCEPGPGAEELTRQARAEGWACYAAAGIDAVTPAEDAARRRELFGGPVDGTANGTANGTVNGTLSRPGGSTWQSLARGTGDVETDYLTGEIVLLGRLHGVPTPVNEVLQRLARRMSVGRARPAVLGAEQILAELQEPSST